MGASTREVYTNAQGNFTPGNPTKFFTLPRALTNFEPNRTADRLAYTHPNYATDRGSNALTNSPTDGTPIICTVVDGRGI